MNDGELLLKAIVADPDDDVARLVYADWLDEHGDHDRAEFVRIQCGGFTIAGSLWPTSIREALLLSVNLAWRPPCYHCGGSGNHPMYEGTSDHELPCPRCNAAKRVGTMERGFFRSVEVPRLDYVLIHEDGDDMGDYWRPTPWALTLAREFPTVERVFVADAVPYTGAADGESFGFQWWDARDANPDDAGGGVGYAPPIVFERMWADWVGQRHQEMNERWLTFKTDADARDALAEAVANILREGAK